MSLEQRVGQLFMVRPEQLAGEASRLAASSQLGDALERFPVGGVCLFSQNMQTAQQVEDFLAQAHSCWRNAGIPSPFLAVDEEGGDLVARVANSGLFNVGRVPNMGEVGASGDPARVADVGAAIAGYLADIGFNVDFAPVADVLPCAKHFPGHGDTSEDSHTGAAVTQRTAQELAACEYVPFKKAIAAGCPMVMVGHIQAPRVNGNDLPASLSSQMIDGVLRGELGFEGVVVADSFEMGAVIQAFDAGEAAVRFIQAGGDLILLPLDLELAYQGVFSAVREGEISQERLDQSVLRILRAKERADLLGH